MFLDSKKRLGGAKMLVVETARKLVGINGIISERNSGKGRFFTGIVVSPSYRRRGIGSLLLHKTLSELKKAFDGQKWKRFKEFQQRNISIRNMEGRAYKFPLSNQLTGFCLGDLAG
jgi:GNAT superfamily N-acetyltransferase